MFRSKILFIISCLFCCMLALCYCIDKSGEDFNPRGKAYTGAGACRECHQTQFDSFLMSAHHWATMPGTSRTVFASFEEGKNRFPFSNHAEVAMEKKGDSLFETLYQNGEWIKQYPIDIVFGFRNGQTFLHWAGNNTFQLPVSYYPSVKKLGTNPGYPLVYPGVERKVGNNCFECHSSFIQTIDEKEKTMDRNSIIFGIDCEACHGPGAEHVKFHTENPGERTAMFIATAAKLTSRQQLDRCAVCHCNDQEKLKSRFFFKPGDSLSDYFKIPADSSYVDVHGDQLGLLAKSKCFKSGGSLNCSTCHGGHSNIGAGPAWYSEKCMTCHSEDKHNFCTATPPAGTRLQDDCIKCHMPLQASQSISFYIYGDSVRKAQTYRTHHIAIYSRK